MIILLLLLQIIIIIIITIIISYANLIIDILLGGSSCPLFPDWIGIWGINTQ